MSGVDDSELDRWLAEVRSGNEARLRQRQHWLAHQATEQATFLGTLTDLAERGGEIVIESLTGRRHTGSLQAVGIDFCALITAGRWIFLPLRAVAAVRSTADDAIRASGERPGALDLTLLEAMSDQIPNRPRVVVWMLSGERIQGELVGVGQDLVTLRLDGQPPRPVHIAAESICEIGL